MSGWLLLAFALLAFTATCGWHDARLLRRRVEALEATRVASLDEFFETSGRPE